MDATYFSAAAALAGHTIRTAIPLMKARGWGRIVTIGSGHSLIASPFKSAYVAAKHGMVGLTKTVALEVVEAGITCNVICPGYVRTALVEGQIRDTAKARGITEEQVIREVMLGEQPTNKKVALVLQGGGALHPHLRTLDSRCSRRQGRGAR